MSISPKWLQRQWRNRYVIHARRNLHDKEFRYFMTVKVTAAARNQLCSRLAPLPLLNSAGQTSDHILHFTILHSPVFLINSPPFHLLLPRSSIWRTFSRSYSANLPSSLEVIHSLTWEFSSRQSVSSLVSFSFASFLQSRVDPHKFVDLCQMFSRHASQFLVVDSFHNNLETMSHTTDSNRTL